MLVPIASQAARAGYYLRLGPATYRQLPPRSCRGLNRIVNIMVPHFANSSASYNSIYLKYTSNDMGQLFHRYASHEEAFRQFPRRFAVLLASQGAGGHSAAAEYLLPDEQGRVVYCHIPNVAIVSCTSSILQSHKGIFSRRSLLVPGLRLH